MMIVVNFSLVIIAVDDAVDMSASFQMFSKMLVEWVGSKKYYSDDVRFC